MEPRNIKGRGQAPDTEAVELLSERYAQLATWARGLARGDEGKAEEIVQEFCLYVTIAKPDLREVANLDGYLYTSLRHIYLSSLARASREALHVVNVEDYDSFALAILAPHSGDALQRQNDLRRICTYTLWRKESSKSASYFILHFFHGYGRQEIAEIARVRISAVYNKLNLARGEVVGYLKDASKLRLVDRSSAPDPELAWTLSSPAELFRELRGKILEARFSDCLPEDALLRLYAPAWPQPISCASLAHIVSCERCLSLIDHNSKRPTLKDREPLDAFGFSSRSGGEATAPFEGVMQSVRRKWRWIHEHRPRKLCIALDGVVIANHDVRSERNRLSARIEHPKDALFVEVFSEQHIRLALLAVGEPPPAGAATRMQRISLSDNRWLELSVSFDGQGLFSEVTYLDPALAPETVDDELKELPLELALIARPQGRLRAAYERFVAAWPSLLGSPAIAWAVATIILGGSVSYFSYRHTPASLDANNMLNKAVQIQGELLEGNTEHQSIQIEETASDGIVVGRGTIDLWEDGNGDRLLRRLYDADHNLVAVQWRSKKDGRLTARSRRPASGPEIENYWDQGLSARTFAGLEDAPPTMRSVDGGFELTRTGPTTGHPQLISATLTLDRQLQPVRQTMRIHSGNSVHEIRFVRMSSERQPSRSVPDSVFSPDDELRPLQGSRWPERPSHHLGGQSDTQAAALEIGVLYQLSALDADTGVPIEVLRTSNGQVRVSGTVDSDTLKDAIITRLKKLDGQEHLDLRIVSSADFVAVSRSKASAPIVAYEVTQPGFAANARIRKYFQAKGVSEERLDAAVAAFSREALQHAQRALQHAYALDRLGTVLPPSDLHALDLNSQHAWAEMVNKHAKELEKQLRSLRAEVQAISPVGEEPITGAGETLTPEDPENFVKASRSLLRQVRNLNLQASEFFASNGRIVRPENLEAALKTIMETIPVEQAEEIASFGERLSTTQGRTKSTARR